MEVPEDLKVIAHSSAGGVGSRVCEVVAGGGESGALFRVHGQSGLRLESRNFIRDLKQDQVTVKPKVATPQVVPFAEGEVGIERD